MFKPTMALALVLTLLQTTAMADVDSGNSATVKPALVAPVVSLNTYYAHVLPLDNASGIGSGIVIGTVGGVASAYVD